MGINPAADICNMDKVLFSKRVLAFIATLMVFALALYLPYSTSLKSKSITTEQSDNAIYGELFDIIETAILERKDNLYRLQKAFFYAPNADPVLLKIVYKLFFQVGENITLSNESYCNETSGKDDNMTYLDFNSTNTSVLTYGWTRSGIYAFIHPSLLNWMQLQLPLVLIRFVRDQIKDDLIGDESLITQVFLWDTSNELPSVYLDIVLDIEKLPCLPSDQILDKVFQDITALVSMHEVSSVGLGTQLDDVADVAPIQFVIHDNLGMNIFRQNTYTLKVVF